MSDGRRPRLLHLTTVDMSLALLLGPQLRAFEDAGYEVIGVSAPGEYRDQVDGLGSLVGLTEFAYVALLLWLATDGGGPLSFDRLLAGRRAHPVRAPLAAMASYLIETKKPTLLAIHIASPDHFMHQDGRRSDLVLRSLGAADRAISAMFEATQRAGIADQTAFVVTGDHGFVDLDASIAPNVWLVEAGLMTAKVLPGAVKAPSMKCPMPAEWPLSHSFAMAASSGAGP